MRKMLVAALIVPVALLGAVRPAKAGNTAAAVLAGVAVGVGAAVILDALVPRPVVAAPIVYQPGPPVVVYQPAPVVYQPVPVIIPAPPVVYQTAPPVVYQPAPVIVRGPRHVVRAPHPVYVRDRHGRGYWADRYIPDR